MRGASTSASPTTKIVRHDSDEQHLATPLTPEKSLEFDKYFGEIDEGEEEGEEDPFEGEETSIEQVGAIHKDFLFSLRKRFTHLYAYAIGQQNNHMLLSTPGRRWTVIESGAAGGSAMLVETPNFLPFERKWTMWDWLAVFTPNWKFVLWAVLFLAILVIFSDELIPEPLQEWLSETTRHVRREQHLWI